VPHEAIRTVTGAAGYTEAATETLSHEYGSEKFGVCLAIETYAEKLGHILEFFVNHRFIYIMKVFEPSTSLLFLFS
jgi:hypothetical protein